MVMNNNTIMGVVTITDAEIGEVSLQKKVSILKATKKKAAAIIRGMAIFFWHEQPGNQNNSIACCTHNKIKP
jgi:hypothetical protein